MFDRDPLVTVMKVEKAPQETYAGIVRGGQPNPGNSGNCGASSHPEYYEVVGINPPKRVIFYDPPGTDKILLARAVAKQTSATFLKVVGSELTQKYLGDA